jgi:hypothetical protein
VRVDDFAVEIELSMNSVERIVSKALPKRPSPATVLSDIAHLENNIDRLLSLIDTIMNYVSKVAV